MVEEEHDAQLEVAMGLIVNGGSAKSSAFEAIHAAKKSQFTLADQKLKESDQFLIKAHNVQTQMLTDEANGEHAKVSLLMVHAQDHIMNAITFRDLAGEIVDLYKKLDSDK
ncbi:PTS lactose/cellobiose transporter subunit IIA [Companilactobacillus jidongensis]|uniref:PTS lactose/cellobiose transporter subunit IIA n=1 Tax=Companilactobacillus jidongensis TaxID=2486006 RepID=UPI000F78900F|nr:PTS lactose/cellobiose transporter subunit IIA [Companilactobacillus jidongensis]